MVSWKSANTAKTLWEALGAFFPVLRVSRYTYTYQSHSKRLWAIFISNAVQWAKRTAILRKECRENWRFSSFSREKLLNAHFSFSARKRNDAWWAEAILKIFLRINRRQDGGERHFSELKCGSELLAKKPESYSGIGMFPLGCPTWTS